jgi:HlyD family secretion protein
MKKYLTSAKKFAKTKKGIAVISTIVILTIILLASQKKAVDYQFVDVTQGPITETVSITGNTSPVESVELGFGSSGIVSRVNTSVGKKVKKGDVLAQVNASDLSAQVRQAQATLDSQQARLEGIQAGSRPEDIAASQAALDKAKQDLDNLYSSISDVSSDAFSKANDAVRLQLDPIFINDETSSVALTYSTNDSSRDAVTGRIAATTILNSWQKNGNESQITSNSAGLVSIRNMLNAVSKTLDLATNISSTTLASHQAAVTTAMSQVNTAAKNLNSLSQNIASQKLTITQLQSQLDLKKAGSSVSDIEAQQAQVENARGALQSVYARLENTRIVSPINGVVTVFDAKIGQLATTGTPLVSIISDNAFEVNSLISEIDIGKVAVGNTVSMTLDAFPGETFTGSVFYIDPAQTTTQGVVGYKIKVAFTTTDPRMKSGLTCNIDISTRSRASAIILPQYAILQNDEGIFVQTLDEKGKIVESPVTIGIQDQEGNVEILSGVSAGQQVLNIGLKQK